jgi:DNA-binding NtrC family response regulator
MEDKALFDETRKLFVIDDDPIQVEMIQDYIQDRYVFEVKSYGDGESAMDDIKKEHPEIIVLDYHLSSQNSAAKNGIEILKEIGKVSPGTKVFMFSGKDDMEIAKESIQNGAFDFIVKGPSAFDKLERTINRLGDMNQLESINKAQKKTITILVVGILLVVLLGLFYFMSQE